MTKLVEFWCTILLFIGISVNITFIMITWVMQSLCVYLEVYCLYYYYCVCVLLLQLCWFYTHTNYWITSSFIVETIAALFWSSNRIDYVLEPPSAVEGLHAISLLASPHVIHSRYWEAKEFLSFVLRQVTKFFHMSSS